MATKQTIEQRAEAEKANYRWHTTTAIGRPLPVGTLRVVTPTCAEHGSPDGYIVSFAGCSCRAEGWCKHAMALALDFPEVWYAGMPDFPIPVAEPAPVHPVAFSADWKRERAELWGD